MLDHIFVFSHRRSGTHLTIDSIINNFKPYYDNPRISEVTLERLLDAEGDNKALDKMRSHAEDRPCVFKCHASANLKRFFEKVDPDTREWLLNLISNGRKIYVYRDGRDVMVSLYYYTGSYSEKVAAMSFAEFLRMPYAPEPHLNKQDMTPVYYWKYHVESWLGREDVLLVSFREMVEGCEEALKKVAEYTGLKPNHNFVDIRLEKIRQARQHSFLTKLIHRCSKKTKTSSVCPRKGKRGDWRNHFDSEDEALFMEVAGDTLSRLGCIKGETDV